LEKAAVKIEKISIEKLPFFNDLIKDYFFETEKLKDLYKFPPTMDGFMKASASKQGQFKNRNLLASIIDENYKDIEISEKVQSQISRLKNDALAIVTAHQPNLFLGPFYVFSKAASIIATANKLNASQKEFYYVPIFVLGAEDHDKEELLHTYLFNQRYEWITEQKGPVGKMLVDDSLVALMHSFVEKFGESFEGEKLKSVYLSAYKNGHTLAHATKLVLNSLFGEEGLIVLDIATDAVKEEMSAYFQKELQEKWVYTTTQNTISFLNKNYKVQAPPREINLFEYKEGERVRIDSFTEKELNLWKENPALLSPNVMLRPLMQQTVLPAVAVIGGGAEVAYWLQQKSIFDDAGVDFPVVMMRDIFSIIDFKSFEKWQQFGFELIDFFEENESLFKRFALKEFDFGAEIENASNKGEAIFELLKKEIEKVDKTLIATVDGEKNQFIKSLKHIQQKAIAAEKRKNDQDLQSIVKIKHKLFENNYLVERKENFSSYFLKKNFDLIHSILDSSDIFDNNFKLAIHL
jgi:bacillithiol biosynthesis cysteine-adding enzyme BshC